MGAVEARIIGSHRARVTPSQLDPIDMGAGA